MRSSSHGEIVEGNFRGVNGKGMKLRFHKKRLQLRETFSIAYGNYNFRDALLIGLSYLDQKGFGECVSINYYGINLEKFILKLKEIQSRIENHSIVHPKEFFVFLNSLNLHSFLLSALDCAYWDLYGKLENQSFAELNSLKNDNLVESSFTISIADIETQIQKMEKSSWNTFKVKCGEFNQNDFEKLVKSGFSISLDANASFKEDDCTWIQQNIDSQRINYFEQPLEIGEFQVLDSKKYANWMADEDAQNVDILEKLQPHYSSINIKLMKCGGLTPALSFIAKAKQLGFKVMLGCMTESSVGISAGCALAGLLEYADLDGANLISNDYAKGSFVENGKIILSEKPGLGISLL